MSRWVFHIELPLFDSWRTIEVLRTTLLGCLATVFESQAYCETLGMVAAELLENAHKYGRRDLPNGEAQTFRLQVTGTPEEVEIAVSNPVDRANPNLQRLFALLDELKAGEGAEKVYLERLRRVAADTTATGGLGLARIAYESGCTVSAEIDGGGRSR